MTPPLVSKSGGFLYSPAKNISIPLLIFCDYDAINSLREQNKRRDRKKQVVG